MSAPDNGVTRVRRTLGSPAAAIGLGVVLLGVGSLHFVAPRAFDAIIPRAFPAAARRPLTLASGVVEVAAGAMLVVPSTRRAGGWLALAALLGVWPANIDAALQGGYRGIEGWAGGPVAAWLRVPLQLPMIAVAWLTARRGPGPARRPEDDT